MVTFRYHLHIVDGGDPTSTITAATLFAHLTLRCGQLRNYLLLSGSTTDAKRRREDIPSQLNATQMAQLAGAENSSGGTTDDKVLLAAQALLRGDENFRATLSDEFVWCGPLLEVKDRIVPYYCFGCNFMQSEVFLARSGVRYFDFVATADVASFNYMLDYYSAVRMLEKKEGELEARKTSCSYRSAAKQKPQEPKLQCRKKVGIIHILCGEPSRAGHLLQRFFELLLEVDSKTQESKENDTAGDEESPGWINRIDGVVERMYQLLGVDVLHAVL